MKNSQVYEAALKKLRSIKGQKKWTYEKRDKEFQRLWKEALAIQVAKDKKLGPPTVCLMCENPYYLCEC